MGLRLIEMVTPQVRVERLRGLLKDADLIGSWEHDLTGDLALVRLLVRSEASEEIVDALEPHCAGDARLRIMILPVEATLPKIAEPKLEPKDAPSERSQKAKRGGRISRAELLDNHEESVHVTSSYLAFTVLASVVAAVGLMRDSVAIIIGAMVIAPLLTPQMGLALATTLGDWTMIRRALRATAVGLGVALGCSVIIGLIFSVESPNGEIAKRLDVGFADMVLALASGVAGALAATRDTSSGLIGVMVAVALLPPLVVVGLMLGHGDFAQAGAAFLLLLTNLICVNLAAVSTFVSQGVRPRTWWEANQARRATGIALGIWLVLLATLVAVVMLARDS